MIEILGERKSGTNYAKRMLTLNFDVELVRNGWKHRLITDHPECDFVVCVRNPYEWLRSLHDKPYHMQYANQLTFSEFIRTHAQDYHKEFPKRQKYANPVRMYNKKMRAYIELSNHRNVFFLKHEDVIDKPFLTFKALGEKLNLKMKGFTNIDKHVDDMGVGRKKFIKKKYPKISIEDKEYISRILNKDVLKFLGY